MPKDLYYLQDERYSKDCRNCAKSRSKGKSENSKLYS